MKQVLIRRGEVTVEELPAPVVERGSIVVAVDHSCISVGTEMSGIQHSGLPLWKRALKNPDKVIKALQMAGKEGIGRTRAAIEGKLAAGQATGYSTAGVVVEVGDDIDDIRPGDRVACAGAQCAHHAELIRVPRNLTVKVPDNVGLPEASTVTLGAIALQGLRRANPTLGEVFVVIGLGILGQLTVQMLKANGCRVIGTDLDEARISLARENGMDFGVMPADGDEIEQVVRITDGVGADGVIITAATPSDSVVSTAFNMCRKKGRVVLVGDVGLNLNRADFYQKELDFFISTSYGPGRYDHRYEEQGLDYPVSYVRWTENRNMSEYLRLLAEGRVDLSRLIDKVYPIEDAVQAYSDLKNAGRKPMMVLLRYPNALTPEKIQHRLQPGPLPKSDRETVRISVIGAGGFAKGMHLPNIRNLPECYKLRAVVSRTAHNAEATSRQFSADYASTDYRDILNDAETDAVLIATRHNLHAQMVNDAIKAGKHVLVEKPLAMNREELEAIASHYREGNSSPVLLTGFNRRFSPHITEIRKLLENRTNPIIVNYRMNAGYIPLDHWVHTEEGGGRNIGEACHIYDLFSCLTNSRVMDVKVCAINPKTGYYSPRDNFVATMSFEDGSVGTLTYTALGNTQYPKETMEVYSDGKVLTMEDYHKVCFYGVKKKDFMTKVVEKGQKEEVVAFANSILKGGEWPIPLWQQVQAMQIAFAVEKQL